MTVKYQISFLTPVSHLNGLAFVEKVKSELGIKALHRELEQIDGTYALRESGEAYRGRFDSKMGSKIRKHTFMIEVY